MKNYKIREKWVRAMRVVQRFNIYRRPDGEVPDGLK